MIHGGQGELCMRGVRAVKPGILIFSFCLGRSGSQMNEIAQLSYNQWVTNTEPGRYDGVH